jgi:hypothetical protein
VAGEVPHRWIAESVANDIGCGTRSVTPQEATLVRGEFGVLVMAACSRLRAVRVQQELGWRPAHTDMLSRIGEAGLRKLADRGT